MGLGDVRGWDMTETQIDTKPRSFPWGRRVAWLLLAMALLYGGAVVYMKTHEADLVFVAQVSRLRPVGQLPDVATAVALPGPQNSSLFAYVMPAPADHDSGYWVLHLHGNSVSAFQEEQIRHAQQMSALGLSVLSFDYRGFGPTPGEPSEQGLYDDAAAAWQWLRARGVPADRIIIWGHSLGSGPATWLATQQPAAALVLFGAFTSIPDVGADTYPYMPVRRLATIHFSSVERLPQVHLPVLVAHTLADKVVPYAHGLKLFAAANEPKRLLSLDAAGVDRLGGHVNGLYENVALLAAPLSQLLGVPLQLK